MRKRPLFLCACVFLAGLVCYRYQRMELICFVLVWLGYEWFCGIDKKRIKLAAGRSMILLSAFILGNIHMASDMFFRDAYLSKIKDGDKVTVWGEISRIETTSTGSLRLILSDCYISLEGEHVPCNSIMVYPSSDQYQVGETHKIVGELHIFEGARNEGGFDSLTYYHSQKIDFCIYLEDGQLMRENENGLITMLMLWRKQLAQVYERSISERTAGFLSGMVLGDKSHLESDLKTLFTNGGIAHILAISGLHVSIIGRSFYGVMRKRGIGFGIAGVAAGVLLLAYCFMVGSSMSAVRAVGMMLLFFVAQFLGKNYDMLNSLGGMMLLLLWENPFLLEYSGFWFSVLALLGVGYVGDVFSRLSKKGAGFLMSVGITLTTLPVVAYCYYEIPLYSPLVNFLLLPVLTPIFVLALAGGIIGLFWPYLATTLLVPCEWGLGIYEWVCQVVEHFPFSMIITGIPSWYVMVVYYVVLLVGTYVIKQLSYGRGLLEQEFGNKNKAQAMLWRKREIYLALLITGICVCLVIFPHKKELEITFLDVGQGDGIYIGTGDGSSYFIDGGSTDEQKLGQYCLLPFLKSNDIEKIDYWFVTHADTDHISGLLEVMESGYKIDYLVVAEVAPEDENMMQLIETAQKNQVEIVYMREGDSLITEQTSLTCIYPGTDMDESNTKLLSDRNETSLVLEYVSREPGEGAEFRALFTGDISSEVEKLLLEKGCLQDIGLYKVAHHGSKYSSSEDFLEKIKPEISIISCGKNNRYGHPHFDTISRLLAVDSDIWTTYDYGALTIRFDDGIEIYSYKQGKKD